MTIRVVSILAALTAIPFTLNASGQAAPGPPGGGITIGFTLPGLQFPFFAAMKGDFDQMGARLGVTVIYIDAQNDSSRQAVAVKSFLWRKVDGIVIFPMKADGVDSALREAAAAGVPVATVGRWPDSERFLVHVRGDDVEGGRLAARYIATKLGGVGGLIRLEGPPGDAIAAERRKGFDDVISQYPAVKIVASLATSFDRVGATAAMRDLLRDNPGFDAVFGSSDDLIIGAIRAMSEAGIDPATKVTTGYDATPEALDLIGQGKLGATIDQLPGRQAAEALRSLVDYIRAREVPTQSEIVIEPKLVSAAAR